MSDVSDERLRRWRLVLGGNEADGTGVRLGKEDLRRDAALTGLYDSDRSGGLGRSAPKVARWLGDIRTFFPTPAVQLMQRDAIERLNLHQLLLEPELLESVEPDVHLVATLLSLSRVMPDAIKETARDVVRRVVEQVEKRLRHKTHATVSRAIRTANRTNRPRFADIDWDRTIRKNLRNYLPEHGVIVPEHLVGRARARRSLQEIQLVVDQSGSMAASVVYAGIFGAVLASLPAATTRMIVFDTEVVDLSEHLQDPVDLLFGTQLGGGTDIHRALVYASDQVKKPARTVMVLITDLYEGGDVRGMFRRAAALVASGVRLICLLALSDDGAPGYDVDNARKLSSLGVPTFACTPDLFPDLIAHAIDGRDVTRWAADNALAPVRG